MREVPTGPDQENESPFGGADLAAELEAMKNGPDAVAAEANAAEPSVEVGTSPDATSAETVKAPDAAIVQRGNTTKKH